MERKIHGEIWRCLFKANVEEAPLNPLDRAHHAFPLLRYLPSSLNLYLSPTPSCTFPLPTCLQPARAQPPLRHSSAHLLLRRAAAAATASRHGVPLPT